MVTVGKTETGKPVCKPLKPDSYFPTYNDAYVALVEYNKNPYDLEPGITVKELYEKWSEEHFKAFKSESSTRPVTAAWAYCSSVYGMRVVDVRARHIKGCIDEGVTMARGQEQHASASTKSNIKSMFNLMLDYALEYEIVDRNYSRTFSLSDDIVKEAETVKKEHIAFTDDEMRILWDHADDKHYVDAILVQCYSGWRPQELGLLELENVDLEAWVFKGGMKTDAGTDRAVPIHPRIQDLVARKYKEAEAIGSKYLFNYPNPSNKCKDRRFTYSRYQKGFAKVRDELKLNPGHRPHDGRTHFVTLAKKYGVDEYAVKYIVGHQISDLTEKVYTKREFDWLKKEIEKIK
jgi:integrase